MDILILECSAVSFALFLGSIAVMFRVTRDMESPTWIIRLAAFFGVIAVLIWWIAAQSKGADDQVLLAGAAGALLVFGFAALLFISSVFSAFEASLTVRLLIEIAKAGGTGITKTSILSRYNRDVIVKKRIERFLGSGDLTVTEQGYKVSLNASFFRFREFVFRVARFLFPT